MILMPQTRGPLGVRGSVLAEVVRLRTMAEVALDLLSG